MKAAPILIALIPTALFGQTYKKHTLQKDRVSIQLSEGTLNIIPITAKAIRVQWEKSTPAEQREFVLINKQPVPQFKLTETASKLNISTSAITVSFDKQKGTIDYADHTGKVFLSETAGSRKHTPGITMGEQSYIAEQGFKSPGMNIVWFGPVSGPAI